MNKYSFKRGWKELKYSDRKEAMKDIMNILNIKTVVSFHRRKRGEPIPRMDEVEKIESVFVKYGVSQNKIWGN
jgi:hypothetical protein